MKATIISIMIVSLGLSVSAQQRASKTGKTLTIVNKAPVMTKADAFRDAMDKLWEEHITFTRLFIVDAAASLPEKDATTARLLQNQVDIGNAIKPYYGDAAGDQLTTLLKEHITTAADVVTAAKMNDKKKLDAATKAWFANADTIAAFLSKANPSNWPEKTLRGHMRDHLNLTTKEAVAQLKGDYAGSIAMFDQVNTQILMMADMLANGIISQFPDKFQ
jgi:hypothetical protein